ncbi:MAG: RNA 2',3'-cyclic phosphodiesterase [Elusimicrobiales bacterium]
MRLFIALETPPALRQAAARAAELLKTAQADVKWTAPECMHFTLHFLGEVPAERAVAAAAALDAAEAMPAFPVELSGIGAFPDMANPRVIWLGAGKGAAEMAALSEAAGARLRELGFETDSRPFAAHLTIGRLKGPRGADRLVKMLSEFRTEAVSGMAGRVCLFESRLLPCGPQYGILRAAELLR